MIYQVHHTVGVQLQQAVLVFIAVPSISGSGHTALYPQAVSPLLQPQLALHHTTTRHTARPTLIRCSAHAMKSVKLFFFCMYLPSSYQWRPISPPPLTCATATSQPRSSRLRSSREKSDSYA
eukprot:GHRQ01023817.1.p1 GENE.GHRQ01023817.1~~GHRQ01023817.1.p1  ORF type:complete len:122 (+),score=6.92 GHRQ01023817.1:484-849(+)